MAIKIDTKSIKPNPLLPHSIPPDPGMPRFTQADEAVFKRTMLPRGPDYKYKPEDIDFIQKETMKDQAVIKNWEKCLRFRISSLSPEDIEEYLKASPESLDGKVMFLPFLS